MFSELSDLLLRLEQLPVFVAVPLAMLVVMIIVGCVLVPLGLLLFDDLGGLRRFGAPIGGQTAQPGVPGRRVRRARRFLFWIEALNSVVGRGVAWLALFMVLVQFLVVVMRYVFAFGSIQLQESIWYMHGVLFMLGAGYTLLKDAHVRIDIFYREAGDRYRAIVDLAGTLVFLFPFLAFIWWSAWSYVLNAWAVREGSTEISGLPYVYLLKTVVLVFVALMATQGIAVILRSAVTLLGYSTSNTPGNATPPWIS
jgi:TRAP-type mannitol/chloroaromatic compound transport system permease small subunit